MEPALFAICKVARRVTIIQDATCLIIMPIDDDKKLEKSFVFAQSDLYKDDIVR